MPAEALIPYLLVLKAEVPKVCEALPVVAIKYNKHYFEK